MGQELAQVDVNDGPEHENLLVLVGVPALQVGSRTKHGHDCTHPVVVVVLARQLLGAELVTLDDLLRAVPSLQVAIGEEDDLCDHGVVRNHHGHGAEQGLEIVRKLCTARIARVHRNSTPRAVLERNLRPFEDERLHTGPNGALDVQNLLRHNGQHL